MFSGFILEKSNVTEVLKVRLGWVRWPWRKAGAASAKDGLSRWHSRRGVCVWALPTTRPEGQWLRPACVGPLLFALIFCNFCIKTKVGRIVKVLIFNKLYFSYIEGKGTKTIIWDILDYYQTPIAKKQLQSPILSRQGTDFRIVASF